MPVTDFTLIRHGQTAENITGRLQGHFDSILDETGILQAKAAANRLAGEHFDAFYSSDLKRAMMTAEVIAETVGIRPEPLMELREWHLGVLEGRLCKELWEEYPAIMNCFKYESGEIPVPGGESHNEFDARVAGCLELLAAKHPDEKVLLVTHGGVMRSIFKHIVGPVAEGSLLPLISNVSYSRFCKRDDRWQLCCWNDVSHLKGIGVRESITF